MFADLVARSDFTGPVANYENPKLIAVRGTTTMCVLSVNARSQEFKLKKIDNKNSCNLKL